MRGRIIKIDPLKESRNKNQAFRRIYFQIHETEKTNEGVKMVSKWYKTDLVTKFRNYKRWSPYLQVGSIFIGLKKKDEHTIDADSKFTYEGNKEIADEHKAEIDEQVKQLTLI